MAVEIETEEPKKDKKKVLLIVVAVLFLVVVAVGAYVLLFSGLSGSSSKRSGKPAIIEELGTAYYVSLPRPFIFNVPGRTRDRMVQITAQLLVRGDLNDELAVKNIPFIEGIMHRVFSASTAESLQTSNGREELRRAVLYELQEQLEELTGSTVVNEVLFTGFVMQ